MFECDRCDRLISKKITCDHCQKPKYCSSDCKVLGTRYHETCPPQKSLRSVDYLLINAYDDEFPTNEQTIKDYGFANCKSMDERINLLGLYIGLLKILRVGTDVLHDHCMKNELAGIIKKTFETRPANVRGLYYPWFLQHQHIVKNGNKGPVKQTVTNVPETTKKSKVKAKPSAKFSVQDGAHIINYGYSAEYSYYYLNVQDPRLAWQSGLSDHVEKVINDIDSSGEGILLQLHTCSSSSSIKGRQVSVETLAQFFKLYGIRNAQIEKMKQGKSF